MYDRIMQRLEAAGKENERTVQELKGNAPVVGKKNAQKGEKKEKSSKQLRALHNPFLSLDGRNG